MKDNKTHRYFIMKVITLVFLLSATAWAITAGGTVASAFQACLMCVPLETACTADGGTTDFCVTGTDFGVAKCELTTPVATAFFAACTAQDGRPILNNNDAYCIKSCD
jgi:hypothetical protein